MKKNSTTLIILLLVIVIVLLVFILVGKKSPSADVVISGGSGDAAQQDSQSTTDTPFYDHNGNEVDTQPGAVHGDEGPFVDTHDRPICVSEFCDGSGVGDGVERTVLQIPIIMNDGGPIGCGVSVRFMPHAVPQTVAVLNATYETLFSLGATSAEPTDPHHNYVADQRQLRFDRAELLNGTASVYLRGSIMGMHCGDPAFRAQIEQAAFQFDTVDSLVVYLNGSVYDWCNLDESDGEGPCGDGPQYWVAEK